MVEPIVEMGGKRKSISQQGSPDKVQKKAKTGPATPKQANKSKKPVSPNSPNKSIEDKNTIKKEAKSKKRFRTFVRESLSGDINADEALTKIEENIKSIRSRPKMSRTGRKKLHKLYLVARKIQEKTGINRIEIPDKPQADTNEKNEKQGKKAPNKKQKAQLKKQQVVQEEENSEEESEGEENSEESEGEANSEELEKDEEEVGSDEEASDEEESEEDNDENNEDEASESDDAEVFGKGKPSQVKKQEFGKYTVFVGNLPFDATPNEIKKHFSKVGEIADIRIPKSNNKSKGFAYVQLKEKDAYEKALSLHHSFLKNRRINVEYSTQGKKDSEFRQKTIKAKNAKLTQLRKDGKLQSIQNKNKKKPGRKGPLKK